MRPRGGPGGRSDPQHAGHQPALAAGLVALVMAGLSACTTAPPGEAASGEDADGDLYAPLERALRRSVDSDSRVDYALLRSEPHDLQSFVEAVATASPETHPGRFPTDQHRLAYWLNAYNGLVLHALAAHPGVRSPLEVLPEHGLFRRMTFEVGGRPLTLDQIEHDIIRSRFSDPRIHFALVCGARSCPKLWPTPFQAEQLEEQLELAAGLFFAQERNLRIDRQARAIQMSAYMGWYAEDFARHEEDHPPAPAAAGLPAEVPAAVRYALRHTLAGRGEALRGAALAGWPVTLLEYDWTLNDQALPESFTWSAGKPPSAPAG